MSDPFDKDELLEELDGDHEFLEESLEALGEDAPPLLAELQRGVEGADGESIRKAAHTLKSMVGNFCAQPAFDAALRMEQIGAAGDLDQAPQAFETLSREVERLQSALQELLEGLS